MENSDLEWKSASVVNFNAVLGATVSRRFPEIVEAKEIFVYGDCFSLHFIRGGLIDGLINGFCYSDTLSPSYKYVGWVSLNALTGDVSLRQNESNAINTSLTRIIKILYR